MRWKYQLRTDFDSHGKVEKALVERGSHGALDGDVGKIARVAACGFE